MVSNQISGIDHAVMSCTACVTVTRAPKVQPSVIERTGGNNVPGTLAYQPCLLLLLYIQP
jgi:hypothetical protein